MSLGNMDVVLHQIQTLVGLNATGMGGFSGAAARQNQGVAMFPDLVRDIAARGDLPPSLNLKLAGPTINTTAVQAVITGAARLVGVIVDSNEASALSYVQLFNLASGSVTIGTSPGRTNLSVVAQTMGVFLFPDMPDYSVGISWDATTGPNGATRSTVTTVRALIVYAA